MNTLLCNKRRRFVADPAEVGLRFEGWSDAVVTLRHRGWYADSLQDEVYRGAVFRLPARRGVPRFMIGYGESLSDGFVLDPTTIWDDDPIGAAFSADAMAERAAEAARAFEEDGEMDEVA